LGNRLPNRHEWAQGQRQHRNCTYIPHSAPLHATDKRPALPAELTRQGSNVRSQRGEFLEQFRLSNSEPRFLSFRCVRSALNRLIESKFVYFLINLGLQNQKLLSHCRFRFARRLATDIMHPKGRSYEYAAYSQSPDPRSATTCAETDWASDNGSECHYAIFCISLANTVNNPKRISD
jgi:hypothetical protein